MLVRMAPTSAVLLPRQFNNGNGNGDGDGPFGDRDDGPGGVSKWAIIGIAIAVSIIALTVGLIIYRRMRMRRRIIKSSINLANTTHNKPTPPVPTGNDPTKYAGNAGYTATADQNQSLLGHAEAPAIVMWDPSQSEHAASTQDGFGYDNNLHLTGGIQRPASVASFSAPPPRYEEITSAPGSSNGPRPSGQGEAASYFNAAVPMADERGRSRSRDAPAEGSRGRGLSADTRSVNGDRRRSLSRFREEGMVDVNVGRA